ncbi:MAG: 2-oxoglutarate dehydrogenase complex dihydrolipoyllysine-residue succinyltransferase [Gammaproteobacteria bacterium SHHR-1]|uniref:2-oxoglutarate dehydrogenase complex dihydrolipoyllysine-residue succinyltransferase n=1 Tax=Magnetovirga frankeli TaxID=947516 RepID=UPI0012935CFA|nr:2-oxoglutarate dehydrogenase complex dihydrolipoyllysine-residue succinyltransferase [gamma proteobacterium SS-5]
MSVEVRVPSLPESVSDATLLGWRKKPGDPVSRDESLLDLETDKVVLEVPAPCDGVLEAQLFQEGDIVSAEQLLATIDPDGQAAARPEAGSEAKATQSQVKPESRSRPEPAKPEPTHAEPPVLTPAVRRLVKELDLDPGKIPGSGKDGRILKSDVMKYLDNLESGIQQDLDNRPPPSEAVQAPSGIQGERPEQRVPMTRLRARIAERLLEAQQNAAILTTFNEVNLQRVNELRQKYRDDFERGHEVRLGFMSFFVKAVVESLKRFPLVNASIDGNDIIYHGYYDIGIAVGSPRGLVVPILRDADQMSFSEIEKAIKAFGKKAQDGSLSYEELSGGTFSISNGGVYGSMLSTPILNPPQSAILGMHNIQQRPIAENGQVVIRPMMYLALSYDHRIIDGKEAVSFLVSIKENLEDPARLLLQI